MAVTIDELQIEIQAGAAKASTGIDALITSLTALKSAAKGGAGLTTVKNQLNALSTAVNSMIDPSGKISAIVSALNQLKGIDKSNLGSALNQLKKIPEITAGLDDAKLSEFSAKILQVTSAVQPLAAEMEKVSAGFSRLPANIQKAINANAKLTASNKSTHKSYGLLGGGIASFVAKMSIAYFAVSRVANKIADWIKESNDYVENLNLFTVAMGEYAGEAQKYAETVGETLGIDPSQWMRNQGIFMTLATGFGVVADKAAIMSKNLTQLGYDLSSFFNIPIEDALQKLQSGISGELEPLRRLGYDLSQARLQEIALAQGITRKVSEMNQAQKSQLRYYAIMTQVTTAQGDMARTLQAPANQLRILQAQATQAARALGNIFIPALNAVLPYAIAFLKVIRMVADGIASLFGFSLPEIDYSGVNGLASGADDATDALGGAAGAAKKLKNQLAGFDELNIITSQAGGGAGGGIGGGGDLGLKLPEYDFLNGAIASQVDEIVAKIKSAAGSVGKFFSDIWANIKSTGAIDRLTTAWNNFKTSITKLADSPAAKTVIEFLKNAVKWIFELGGTIVADVFTGLLNVLTDIVNIVDSIGKGDVSGIVNGVKNLLADLVSFPFTIIADLIDKIFGTNVRGWIDDLVKSIKNFDLARWFEDAWATISKTWSSVASWFSTNVIKPVTGFFQGIYISVSGFFSQLWTDIKNVFTGVSTWFQSNVTDPISNFFKGAINSVIDMLNYLIHGLNKVRIELPQWDILGNLAGRSYGINIKPIDRYATGGFPEQGQLFMAQDDGPELVGSIGNKTAVINNSQIIEGISNGVARASAEDRQLLRELVSIGRAMLEKESGPVFAPSAEAGRWARRSLGMYDAARGTT